MQGLANEVIFLDFLTSKSLLSEISKNTLLRFPLLKDFIYINYASGLVI